MIELPECYVLADQIKSTLTGKTIINANANFHPHKFAWYNIDPEDFGEKLSGRKITGANPGTGYTCGGNTEILCEDAYLVLSTPIKYHPAGSKLPPRHQLLLEFDDGSHLSSTIQMWGSIFYCTKDKGGIPDDYTINKTPKPIEEDFDETYFEGLLGGVKTTLSAKAFLATEQRIPGLGNGVLQDILFNAHINPRTKLKDLDDNNLMDMFRSVKSTLHEMMIKGGRDTERDLFSDFGGYHTILSKKTIGKPCPVCGGRIVKEAYLGGNIYYCTSCQK